MPRTSDKSDALRDIETFIKSATCDYLLASTSSEEKDAEEDIEDLLCIHEVLVSYRYLSCGNSAGRHSNDCLEVYIHQYPDPAFLILFHMHRVSFWQVVELLSEAGGAEYWCQGNIGRGRRARPIYQQIAHQQQRRFASHMSDTLHTQYQNRTTRRHGMPTYFPNATHAYPLP